MNEPEHRAQPVAIIGMACMFPGAEDLQGYWHLLRAGVDGISEVPSTHWNPEDYYDSDPSRADMTYCRRGGFLSPVSFDPTEFSMPPTILEATDTSQILGLVVSKAALDDAGYGSGREFDRERTSVILGVTGTLELVIPLGARLGHPLWRRALLESGVDPEVAEEVVRRIADDYVPWQENSFPGLLGNVVAGRVANRLDLHGTNCVVDAACASTLSAAHLAVLELQAGRADMVLTGGVDTFNDIFMYMCFSKTPALSPSGEIRPFSDGSDGTLLGEGIGAVVLKRLADARRDGDKVYALIRGLGTASDGSAQAIYAPYSPGQARALRDAYRVSGVDPRTVELVEAHGTGTKVGDVVEFEALREVFGQASPDRAWCALGTVKSQIGHTKAAAGAAGLIKAALALHHKVLPPTLKVEQPNPKLKLEESPFYLNTEARPWLASGGFPRRAALSSFGFGGSNYHVVLEEAGTERAEVAWDGSVRLAAVSGDGPQALASQLRALADSLKKPGTWAVARLAARSCRQFSPQAEHRLVLVLRGDDLTDPRPLLRKTAEAVASGKSVEFYGQGAPAGKLAFLFPGQGSQSVGMGRELFCVFPEALESLQAAGPEVSGKIFPRPAFSPEERRLQQQELTATDMAQPALGAVSLAMMGILERFGVRPEMAAGHSYGELCALYAAGCFDRESLFGLSHLRGALMAKGDGGRGAMLAVTAAPDEVEQLLTRLDLRLALANRNSPRQTVLSGEKAEIARAQELLSEQGWSVTRLPVSAAFHSELVASAREPFRAALGEVPFAAPSIPVYANRTAAPYPEDPEAARELLAEQLVSQVDFVGQIRAMVEAGARVFVEAGPRNVLGRLVKAILADAPHHVVGMDAGKGRGLADLAGALAQLAALGYPVDLAAWELAPPEERKNLMEVELVGANYRAPRKKEERPRPHNGPARAAVPPVKDPQPGRPIEEELPPVVQEPPSTALDGGVLGEAFRSVQASLEAMQTLQRQTAEAHHRFLEGQEAAQRTFQQVVEGQQRLVESLLHGGSSLQAAPPAAGPTPRPAAAAPSPRATAPPAAPSPRAAAPPAAPSPRAVAPSAPAAPVPVPQPTAVAAPPSDRVAGVLLEVVSEKTGYPAEMLHLDMDLEADLGIDSIKRVEILAALAEALPELPGIEPDRMGSLRTLREVVAGLPGADGGLPAPAQPARAPAGGVERSLLEVVAEKTGYPLEMLNLGMDLEADLGIDSIKRVEILAAFQERVPHLPVVEPERMGSLRTLAEVVAAVTVDQPPAARPEIIPPEPAPAIASRLLEVVAEKTGYPVEMLNLEMDLEADLGVDSIKRVEILAALQEEIPGLPPVDSDRMGSLRTLRQIVESLGTAPPSGEGLAPLLLEVVAEKTGYPVEMLNLDMDLEADLGIDSIKRVEILAAVAERDSTLRSVEADRLGGLRTLRQVLDSLAPSEAAREPELSLVKLGRRVLRALPSQAGPGGSLPVARGHEVVVVDDGTGLGPALVRHLQDQDLAARQLVSPSGESLGGDLPLGGLILVAGTPGTSEPRRTEEFLRRAFRLVRAAGPALRQAAAAGGGLLATVSRMDGAFGLEGRDFDALAGGLAGLPKTAAHEWPEVACRALDVAPEGDPEETAAAIVAELGRREPLEVGLAPGVRRVLGAVEAPATPGESVLAPGDVVVVTGGARGVTAEAAVALARSSQPRLVLLGRSEPEPEPSWLQGLEGEAELKRAILAHEFRGGRPSPAELEGCYRSRMASREVIRTLERIQAAGSQALYRSVDVRDAEALDQVLQEVRRSAGPIRGVIHAAGVLADRRIEDKLPEQFELVFDTKVAGLRNLLASTESDELKALVLFSSVTARYGRPGQVDYCMANEVLNKVASLEARRRPGCRVVAINWGPWEGGMVTPGLRKEFERLGVGLIPLAAGAECLVAELGCRQDEVEVLIGDGFPEPAPALADPAAMNGKRVSPSAGTRSQVPEGGAGVSPLGNGRSLAFSKRICLEELPLLGSHVIGGRPVLPMALMLEWFGQAALHSQLGMRLVGLDHLHVYKGVVLEGPEPVEVGIYLGAPRQKGDWMEIDLEMRDRAAGTLHAGATALLGSSSPETPEIRLGEELQESAYPHDPAVIYGELLFHGPDLYAVQKVRGSSPAGMVAQLGAAPSPADWERDPLRTEWVTDPMALDGALQVGILWCLENLGKPSLPAGGQRYRQYSRFPREGVTAALAVADHAPHRLVGDVTFLDAQGQVVARFEGLEWTADASLRKAFARKAGDTVARR